MNILFPTLLAQKVQNIWNRDQGIVDEGSYFVATNPTPGTGIATTTSITAETQVSPVLLLQNQWTPGDPNAKNIYPLSLKMLFTAAPTSATAWQYSLRLDVTNPSKYTSGGSLITPQSANGFVNSASKALIYFGAIVSLTGASGSRLLGGGLLSPTIPLVKDQHTILFGRANPAALVNTVAVNVNRLDTAPPIVVGPGQWLSINLWGGSNAGAPAWEFQLDYVER